MALAVFFTACAGSPAGQSTVLETMDRIGAQDAPSISEEIAPKGPIVLQFRPPDRRGNAYRLVAEITSKRATSGSAGGGKAESSKSSHLLELEYRESPVDDSSEARRNQSLLRMDGLHYKFRGGTPITKREIEIWNDRMVVHEGDKITLDIRGSARRLALKPRAFLDRVFGILVHDANGNAIASSRSGSPTARDFLAGMPIWGAIGYSLFSFPAEAVGPGSQWTSIRQPPTWAGDLGVLLTIHYTLVGYTTLDDVPTAVVQLRGESLQENYQLPTGTSVSGLVATLNGTAWIDLETSRLRRMTFEDTIKILISRPSASGSPVRSRISQSSKFTLETRDPTRKPSTWSDGTRRFGSR